MRLTRYTDYALRVLIYLAARPEELSAINDISRAYGISQNHLMKVVSDLASNGYVTSLRGRKGGIRLAVPAKDINVGDVVRHTEEGFDLVDCGSCIIAPACGLTSALHDAVKAFLAVLDGYTLADLVTRRSKLRSLLTAA
jgi:Rrf2 family transcriptional regulator, nitric oxide-sensitive transcriptional repressor